MLVGRLDFNSEGLLLLTNDGELARSLELPSTGWVRQYRVRAYGPLDESRLGSLAGGITVDGIKYQGIQAQLDKRQGDNSWITVSLQEGKNREIRKVMEYLGLRVNRLIRIAYGPFELGELHRDTIREVSAHELNNKIGLEPGKPREFSAKLPPMKSKAAATVMETPKRTRDKNAHRGR